MEKSKKFIPNLNTFSALVDRLIIENIKLVNFENKLLDIKNGRLKAGRKEFKQKIFIQKSIISLLKNEISDLLEITLRSKQYETLPEKRTFQA